MADTYTLISSVTVGAGGAASIDFTSIPATYTDLCLVISVRSSLATAATSTYINFNGDNTAFSSRYIEGTGSSVGSYTSPAYFAGDTEGSTATASTFSSHSIYIPNYAGSTNKSFSVDSVTENNATAAYATLSAGLWSNTSAINRVTVLHGGNWVQYSTAYLYGIKNS